MDKLIQNENQCIIVLISMTKLQISSTFLQDKGIYPRLKYLGFILGYLYTSLHPVKRWTCPEASVVMLFVMYISFNQKPYKFLHSNLSSVCYKSISYTTIFILRSPHRNNQLYESRIFELFYRICKGFNWGQNAPYNNILKDYLVKKPSKSKYLNKNLVVKIRDSYWLFRVRISWTR